MNLVKAMSALPGNGLAMKFNVDRKQKQFEEVLRKQQQQILRISKELEVHREFLNMQFDSFMEFFFQNGGQLIKNGREEGMFLPLKRDQNGGGVKRSRQDDEEDVKEEEDVKHNVENGRQTEIDDEREGGRDDGEESSEPLPPPQAILGEDGAECSDGNDDGHVNGNYQKRTVSRLNEGGNGGQSSRRSSQNVVSSSDAQNGEVDEEEYEDEEGSEGAYEGNGVVGQQEMMKYVQNFMFSHFLNGGGEEDNGMEDSYNDEEMGGYEEGEEDDMDIVESSRPFNLNRHSWSASSTIRSNAVNNLQQLAAKQVATSNPPLPIPNSNIPHNERTCRYCGKTFHWKQSWVIHERTHTGEKPYLCKCGKAFSQKSNMNTHAKSCAQAMTTQKGKTTVFQMKCSHCQKMFTHKKNLDLHMEKFHPEVLNLSVKPSTSSSSSPTSSSINPYQNGLDVDAAAARAAAENAAILNILKSVSSQVAAGNNSQPKQLISNARPISPQNDSLSGGEEKNGRYPCHYCPKRFPVKGTLERHLRVHTGEKPFLCGICGKAFTQKGSVKLHLERVHRQTM